jgi:hypothetical protein
VTEYANQSYQDAFSLTPKSHYSTISPRTKNVSSNLLKEYSKKQENLVKTGLSPTIKKDAKKSFLNDSQVRTIIDRMLKETNKKVDKLRLD